MDLGLRRYEMDLWSRREQLDHRQEKMSKVGTVSEEEFRSLKEQDAKAKGGKKQEVPPGPPSAQEVIGEQANAKQTSAAVPVSTSVWTQKAKERAATTAAHDVAFSLPTNVGAMDPNVSRSLPLALSVLIRSF